MRLEEAEVFLFGEEAAIEEGEARDGEGGGGDVKRAAVGAEDEATGGVALEIERGIAARPGGLDVSLLGAEAGDDLQAAVEQGGVAAEEGGGDGSLGVFGIIYGGAILGVGIDGEVRGRGDVVGVELGVADPVDLREAEGRDALEKSRSINCAALSVPVWVNVVDMPRVSRSATRTSRPALSVTGTRQAKSRAAFT